MKKILNKFIFCGLNLENESKRYMQYLLHNSVILIISLALLTLAIASDDGHKQLLYVAIVGVIIINYVVLYITQWISLTIYIGSFVLIFSVNYFTGIHPFAEGHFSWLMLVPFFIFILHDIKVAIAFSILHVLLATVTLHYHFNTLPLMEEINNIMRPISVLLTIDIFLYLFENNRSKHLKKIDILLKKEKDQNKRLLIQAETDALTGLCNRKKIDDLLEYEVSRAKRSSEPFSFLLIDIDFFKEVNDKFGHQAGDVVIKEFSSILLDNSRKIDKIGRWGGEEFVVILPYTTLNEAALMANSLVKKISTYCFTHEFSNTATIGIASFHEDDTPSSILQRADKALYLGKEFGRNRVVTEIELNA